MTRSEIFAAIDLVVDKEAQTFTQADLERTYAAGFEAARKAAEKVCAEEYTTGIAMERIRALPVPARKAGE